MEDLREPGEFSRAPSASWVTRESPQLQPLRKPEAIFKSVKLRSLGVWEADELHRAPTDLRGS